MKRTAKGTLRCFGALTLAAFVTTAWLAHHEDVRVRLHRARSMRAMVIPFSLQWDVRSTLEVAASDEDLSGLARRIPSVRFLAVELDGISRYGLSELSRYRQLTYLELRGAAGGGKGEVAITEAARLPSLKALDLGPARGLGDWDLRGLADLERLQVLRIGELHETTAIGDRGIEAVTGLRNLEDLRLVGTEITSWGLGRIADMRGLKALDLDQSRRLADRDFAALAYLSNLRSLNLARTAAGDEAARAIAGMRGLQKLNMESTALTDAGLRHLEGHPGLRKLNLSFTEISDRGARSLTYLRNLRELELTGCRALTSRGTAELREMRNLKELRLPAGAGGI